MTVEEALKLDQWARAQWRDFFARDAVARGALAIAVVFVLVTAVLWRFRNLPYYWDAVGYVFSHSAQIHDTNLFPILTTWDVGHPTLFYFVVAVFMKLFGVGPLAGHLATWLFTSLLLVSLYGCARALELPRCVSAATVAVIFLFPLTFASSLQITLDLPLTALVITSIWFWSRRSWVGYFIVGSMAMLVKLYGFLLIPGLLLGLVAVRLIGDRGRSWWGLLSEAIRTTAPLIALIVFMIIRFQVRGPGLTIAWESGNKPVPIWDWPAFSAYFPAAFEDLFVASMLDRILVFAVMLSSLLVLSRAVGHPSMARFTPGDRAARVLGACGGMSIVLGIAFFQSLSLCARYNLPTVCALFLIISFCLWNLLRSRAVVLVISLIASFVFVACWHPRIAESLPSPLGTWLRRPAETQGSRFENDLRFLDVIELMKWGGREISSNAKRNHKPRAVSTNWPFYIAFADERFGYLDKRLDTHAANLWSEVEGSRHPYVLIIKPISNFDDQPPPPSSPFTARKIGTRTQGDAEAQLWLIRKNTNRAE
ncbi:glycosyltransferase family 39 protein [Candidatus Sumerlaeota bacterium]|nr:glycosyltransferase family 39 protein [Candidatus Sumerlaeota bacterium]